MRSLGDQVAWYNLNSLLLAALGIDVSYKVFVLDVLK